MSTEDDLMRIFQGERIAALMDRLGVDEETPIQNRAVSKTLEAAQKRVEGYNFDTRKSVVQYDNVINRHRRVVYVMRRKILEGDNIKPEIERLLRAKVHELAALPTKNNPKFVEDFTAIFPSDEAKISKIGKEKKDKLRYEKALKLAEETYAEKESEIVSILVQQFGQRLLDCEAGEHLRGVEGGRALPVPTAWTALLHL